MVSRTARRAFTLVEFLVLISIALVLLSIFVPYAMSIREAERRTRCAKNLNVLRNALVQYREINGIYPRTIYDIANKPNGYTAYTGPDAAEPFTADTTVKPNDVTASLWLLVRTGMVTDTSIFICPSTSDRRDPLTNAAGQFVKGGARSNFRKPENLSYSYATPFGNAEGYKLDDLRQSGFILLADKNPGVDPSAGDDVTAPPFDAAPAAFAQANSHNHGRAGQNVLTVEGNVFFDYTPYCGVGRVVPNRGNSAQHFGDNIYTALANVPLLAGQKVTGTGNGVCTPNIGPAWHSDSYLVPTARDFPVK